MNSYANLLIKTYGKYALHFYKLFNVYFIISMS